MPTVKTVSVTYDRKINLGDYNSATVGLTVWADIDEGEDLDAAMRALWIMATDNVKAKAETFKRNIAAESVDLFLGLPLSKEDCNAD